MDWLGVKEFIKDSFIYIIIFIVILLSVIYIVSFSQVIGPSMKETLDDKDVVIISKLHYKLGSINRKDVIAFNYKGKQFLMKRIIGLPNEKVSFKDSKVYIDDILLEEDYIIPADIKDKDYGVVPEDSYFIMGDNRGDSLDSRNFGFIKKSDIIGKVILRLFPFNKIGTVK